MGKSKEILIKKAELSEPLKEIIKNQPEENKTEDEEKASDKRESKVLVFQDPLYSKEKKSIVNYSIFRGKWEFENLDQIDDTDPEKCAVTFTPVKDGSNITIAFKSLKDRVEFMDSVYSHNEMKQIGGGMSFEKIVNSKILKTTTGIIGLSLAGYGIYKFLSKLKEIKNGDE